MLRSIKRSTLFTFSKWDSVFISYLVLHNTRLVHPITHDYNILNMRGIGDTEIRTLWREATTGSALAMVMKQYAGSLHVYSRPISGSRPTRISRVNELFSNQATSSVPRARPWSGIRLCQANPNIWQQEAIRLDPERFLPPVTKFVFPQAITEKLAYKGSEHFLLFQTGFLLTENTWYILHTPHL
jgi:hypothetical protein